MKSALCFGVIDLVVLLLGVKTVASGSLVALLYGGCKNEKSGKHQVLSVCAFLLSAALLCAGYLMLMDNGMQSINAEFYGAALCALLGTFLFFRSLAGMLLWVVSHSKVYLRGLNMFVTWQLSARIRTVSTSMAVVCLLLSLSICMLSGGVLLNSALRDSLAECTPVDVTIFAETGGTLPDGIEAYFQAAGMELNNYADRTVSANLYRNGGMLIFLSDCNALLSMLNDAPLRVDSGEYATIYVNEAARDSAEAARLAGDKEAVFGRVLTPSAEKAMVKYLWNTDVNSGMDGTILVVPDEVLVGQTPHNTLINFQYRDGITDGDFQQTINDAFGEDYILAATRIVRDGAFVEVNTRDTMYGEINDLRASTTIVILYVAMVLLLSCAAVLSLQQLTEAEDNRARYALLEKLGAEEAMLRRALTTQIAVCFLLPLTLSVIHASVGLHVLVRAFVPNGIQDMGSLLATAAFPVIVYGGYFLATCQSAKSILTGVNDEEIAV